MEKAKVLRALTLLAQAYAFAKDGQNEPAGKLLVQAAEDGDLDEVMDGVAQGAEDLEDEKFDDIDDDDEGEGYDEGDDEGDDTTIEANVQLPESVARLAARTLI